MVSTNKSIFLAVAIVAIIAIGAVIFFRTSGVQNGGPTSTTATRTAAPADVTVPNKGDTVAVNVAAPIVVAAAGTNVVSNLRSFDLALAGGQFSPSTVIVNFMDIVHLTVSSQDGTYDFAQPDYGLSTGPIAKGKVKTIEFQANNAGKFSFFCASCGGPGKGPVGYLIVVKK